jgi:CRP/FNR family transcriptional regulator, cyclic AMP receptor protein
MSTSFRQVTDHARVADPLAYLPYKDVIEYRRGQVVFEPNQAAGGIHLVVQGKVKVCRPTQEGMDVVVDVYRSNEFFGEAGLIELTPRTERAVAMERSQIMTWTTDEIEEVISARPELGFAFIQLMVNRSMDLCSRLESFAAEKTPQRVARSLLRFADRFGSKADDGSVRIPPMTHQFLSEYVGTSREIVTFNMNHLRQQGFIRYSRKGIELFADALRENLRTV